jgi:hypothetical protein
MPAEFMEIIRRVRESIGTKLLTSEELLFITADDIAHSYTMNERKTAPEGDVQPS